MQVHFERSPDTTAQQQAVQDLRSNIDACNRQIEHFNANIANMLELLKTRHMDKIMLRMLRQHPRGEDFMARAEHLIGSSRHNFSYRIQYIRQIRQSQHSLQNYQTSLARHQQNLTKAEQALALAKLQPTTIHTLDTDKTIAQLESRPDIKAARISVHENILCMDVEIHPLQAQSSSDSVCYRCTDCEEMCSGDQGEDCGGCEELSPPYPEIDIPACTLRVIVDTQNPHNHHKDFVADERHSGFCQEVLIHPHALQGGPCLGDFSNGFAQNIVTADLVAATDILVMFLKYYNPEDAAGKYFENWQYNPVAESSTQRANGYVRTQMLRLAREWSANRVTELPLLTPPVYDKQTQEQAA
jgi:hypothetical protein